MHARVVTITGARNIDAGISFLRDTLLPVLRDQKGYRGLNASADRSRGVMRVLTLWDTEAERDASWDALAPMRQDGQDTMGGDMSSNTYEVLLQEIGDVPPAPGSALMLMPVSMEPARVDEHLATFRSDILPEIKAAPGFQAVRLLMNRSAGEGMTATFWSGQGAMMGAAAAAESRRQRAAARGVRLGEPDYREVVFSDAG
jgi:heme-degrading monooxygenase HmoA